MRVHRSTLPWFRIVGVLLVSALWKSSGSQRPSDGRLTFASHAPTGQPRAGKELLGLGGERDGFLFVPRGNGSGNTMPLLILLHGATQRAR